MAFELQRYTAVTADETRAIVIMLGPNGPAVIPVNTGPGFTPKRDVRRLKAVVALVIRLGYVVAGVQLSIVTLTGHKGDTWLAELDSGIQGWGDRVRLREPVEVEHGVGAFLLTGALTAGDIVQIGAWYE